MGSDWQYIQDHMGGHDEDGLPNFMSEPGFSDDSYSYKEKEKNWFASAKEAQDYAKANPGIVITRSADGNGYIVKDNIRK